MDEYLDALTFYIHKNFRGISMKLYNNTIWFSFLFLLIVASGCVPFNGSVTVSPSILPTESKIPTQKPIATSTLLPFPTVTPVLSIEDAQKILLELLANNGGCRLPCLWGITPGKSTYQESQTIFNQLSMLSDRTSFLPEGGTISPIYTDGNLMLRINTGFNIDTLSDNQVVKRVGFQARALKRDNNGSSELFDWPFFSKQLDYYMLPNILSEYGSPTTVMLSTMAKLPSSGVPGGFKILLLYPDQGILVNYTMQMQLAGENIIGCPSNAHVEFELFPSGQADLFFDLLEPSGWSQIIQKTYKSIDEVTSMTKEDFYQIFSQRLDECILTPANLWPIPN
jgi:hypothetical protein